jgi:signal peptidase II
MQKMQGCLNSKWAIAFLSIFIFLGDQVLKFMVVRHLRLGEQQVVLSFFNIVRLENKGISFGIFNGTSMPLVWVSLAAVVVVSLCLWAKDKRHCWLASAIIVSGAIGNSVDRLIYGAVVDFLDFHISTCHWPAFNIADGAIVVGAVILFFISNREAEL